MPSRPAPQASSPRPRSSPCPSRGSFRRPRHRPRARFADAHFTEDQVFTGLTWPTTVRFASDGRAFVAEKRGIIKAYDSVGDNSPDTVLDIRSDVHDFWDRGLLSIALDPDFLNGRNYLYVYYVYDAPPGQSAPYWNDACPTPPGSTTDGCVVRSKLDRYTVNLSTNVATATG